jgi:hypothetical protein
MTETSTVTMTKLEARPQKGLIVSLDGDRPAFEFLGEWNGHNIMSVYNHLRRAYHLHNRETRRKLTLKDLPTSENTGELQ